MAKGAIALGGTFAVYSHRAWFFGGGDLPGWAGCTVGFRIAGIPRRRPRRFESYWAEAATVIERYVARLPPHTHDRRGERLVAVRLPAASRSRRTIPRANSV
jgi:hypothetical protein